jgi:MSHA pilin protein MshD
MPMWGIVLTRALPRQVKRQKGFTLIELVAVIIILAISLVGVTAAISGAISRSSDVLLETRAVALAQSYLDEILAKRFDERTAPRGIPPCRSNCTDEVNFGLDGGESDREDFDDVDDYHGLDEGLGQANPLQDAEGQTRLGYDNFRVRVSVRYLELGVGDTEENLASAVNDLTDEKDAKLITVTVNHASVFSEWSFSVYKSNF